MAQAVCRRPLTVEARVRNRISQRSIYGGQSSTGAGFSPSPSVSPVSIIPPVLHTHIIYYHLRDKRQADWRPQF
jgi:hypothetical protein